MIDITIPAYNEEKRIGKTLDAYLDFFDDVRLTVVLNGCVDGTENVVRERVQKNEERVRMIVVHEAIGKGAAIVRGWEESSGALVGFVDADGATSPEEFSQLIDAMDGQDGTIASRFIDGAQVHERTSRLRTLMSHGFIALVRFLFKMPFRDTQCGAKLFRANVVQAVLPHLTRTDMTFDVELLWLVHNRGYAVQEVPTVWVDQPGSAALGTHATFLKTGSRMVKSLFSLRRDLRSKH
jgi:glycosyltransferase involved in cell wall biosynthesis